MILDPVVCHVVSTTESAGAKYVPDDDYALLVSCAVEKWLCDLEVRLYRWALNKAYPSAVEV